MSWLLPKSSAETPDTRSNTVAALCEELEISRRTIYEWRRKNRGLPVSHLQEQRRMKWFDFACAYIDMKWPDASPKYRKSLAESMVAITVPMLDSTKPLPESKLLRKSLYTAFSKTAREKADSPEIVRVRW